MRIILIVLLYFPISSCIEYKSVIASDFSSFKLHDSEIEYNRLLNFSYKRLKNGINFIWRNGRNGNQESSDSSILLNFEIPLIYSEDSNYYDLGYIVLLNWLETKKSSDRFSILDESKRFSYYTELTDIYQNFGISFEVQKRDLDKYLQFLLSDFAINSNNNNLLTKQETLLSKIKSNSLSLFDIESLKISIKGTKSFSNDKYLKNLYEITNDSFCQGNIYISIIGNIDVEKTIKMLETVFKNRLKECKTVNRHENFTLIKPSKFKFKIENKNGRDNVRFIYYGPNISSVDFKYVELIGQFVIEELLKRGLKTKFQISLDGLINFHFQNNKKYSLEQLKMYITSAFNKIFNYSDEVFYDKKIKFITNEVNKYKINSSNSKMLKVFRFLTRGLSPSHEEKAIIEMYKIIDKNIIIKNASKYYNIKYIIYD